MPRKPGGADNACISLVCTPAQRCVMTVFGAENMQLSNARAHIVAFVDIFGLLFRRQLVLGLKGVERLRLLYRRLPPLDPGAAPHRAARHTASREL